MKSLPALALAALLAAPQAHAMLMPPMATPLAASQLLAGAAMPATEPDWTHTLQVQQFDASLGTLNSITLTLSGLVHAEFTGANNSARQALLSNRLYGSLEGLLPDGSMLQLLFEGADDRLLAAGGSYSGVVIERDGTASVTLTSGFAPFVGTGSFDVNLSAIVSSTITAPGAYDMDIGTWASANVDVVYDYTAATQNVPEPGAMALVAMALAAAALTRRRAA